MKKSKVDAIQVIISEEGHRQAQTQKENACPTDQHFVSLSSKTYIFEDKLTEPVILRNYKRSIALKRSVLDYLREGSGVI